MTTRVFWYVLFVLLCCSFGVILVQAAKTTSAAGSGLLGRPQSVKPKAVHGKDAATLAKLNQTAELQHKVSARASAAPEPVKSAPTAEDVAGWKQKIRNAKAEAEKTAALMQADKKQSAVAKPTEWADDAVAKAAALAADHAWEAAKFAEAAANANPPAFRDGVLPEPVVAQPLIQEQRLLQELQRVSTRITAAKAAGLEPTDADETLFLELESLLNPPRPVAGSHLDEGGATPGTAPTVTLVNGGYCDMGTFSTTDTCSGLPYNGRWYRVYIGPSHAGTYRLTTCGSPGDTEIRTMKNKFTCGTVTYNDACSGLDAVTEVTLYSTDSVIWVEIGYNTAQTTPGIYNFNVWGPLPTSGAPSNDICANAIALNTAGDIQVGTTRLATVDAGLPSCGNTTYYGVWYTLAGNGYTYTLSTNNNCSSFNTNIAVFTATGTCSGTYTCVAYNTDVNPATDGNSLSEISFCADNGMTYYVLVYNWLNSPTLNGPFTLTLTLGSVCACDSLPTCGPSGETEPDNNACGTAGFLGTDTTLYAMHCTQTDSDYFALTIPGNSKTLVTLYDGTGCTTTPCATKAFRYREDTCSNALSSTNIKGNTFLYNCTADPRMFYLVVYGLTSDRAAYKLTTSTSEIVFCGWPRETEGDEPSNNHCDSPDSLVLGVSNPVVYAMHCCGDSDYYQITVPRGRWAWIQVLDGDLCCTSPSTKVTKRLKNSTCTAWYAAASASPIVRDNRSGLVDSTYFLGVWDVSPSACNSTPYEVVVRLDTVPSNDFCVNATVLTIPLGGVVATTCTTATATTDNPTGACAATHYRNVWFKVRGNGHLDTISTCGSNSLKWDGTMSMYRGTSCSDLVCVYYNDTAPFGCAGTACYSSTSPPTIVYCMRPDSDYWISVGQFNNVLSTDAGIIDFWIKDGPNCMTGRCCYNYNSNPLNPACTEGITEADCQELGNGYIFTHRATCASACRIMIAGENCFNPFVINALAFDDTGSTGGGFGNDYDFSGTYCISDKYDDGPDVVYEWLPTSLTDLDIVLNCVGAPSGGNAWGSISIWDGCPNGTNCVAGNYSPSATQLTLSCVPTWPGHTYYIMVDNYAPGPDSIRYGLHVSECFWCPTVSCSYTMTETEPDDGCLAATYQGFNTVSDGSVVQGSVTTDGTTRDFDGYELAITTAPVALTVTVRPEFNAIVQLNYGTADGSCPDSSALLTVNSFPRCSTETFTYDVPANGLYHIYVYPTLTPVISSPVNYCMTVSMVQGSVPDNDLCADAYAVDVPSSTTGTTRFATADYPSDTVGCGYYAFGPGVWYTVQGTGDSIFVSLCNSASSWNSKINVYTSSCDSPVCYAYNDDYCAASGHARVAFCTLPDTTYYILVYSSTVGLAGGFTLDVTAGGGCRACDSCTPADADLGVITTTEWGGLMNGNCRFCGKWVGSFSANYGDVFHFDLCADASGAGSGTTDLDIKICDASCTILTGEDGACEEGNNWLPNDFLWTATTSGTHYVIVAPYPSNASHNCKGTSANTFTLNYYHEECLPPPPNDECTAVSPIDLPLDGSAITFTGDNTCATLDCEYFSNVGEGNAWHAFTLNQRAIVVLDYCTTAGPFGNAWLNCALGCPCTGYTAAATFDTTSCGDGNITMKWTALAPATYYYPVLRDQANNARGPYTIHVKTVQLRSQVIIVGP
jgi:hypothetical protein